MSQHDEPAGDRLIRTPAPPRRRQHNSFMREHSPKRPRRAGVCRQVRQIPARGADPNRSHNGGSRFGGSPSLRAPGLTSRARGSVAARTGQMGSLGISSSTQTSAQAPTVGSNAAVDNTTRKRGRTSPQLQPLLQRLAAAAQDRNRSGAATDSLTELCSDHTSRHGARHSTRRAAISVAVALLWHFKRSHCRTSALDIPLSVPGPSPVVLGLQRK